MRGRYEQALAEVEEMKRRLREHAQRVAAREKELEELREPARDPNPENEPPPPTPLPQPPSEPDLDPAAGAKLRRSSMLADPQLKKPR